MLVIGLVGGIASGKSFVAGCFGELGCEILDADRVGHEALQDPAVVAEVQKLWPHVAIVDGILDRKSLGKIVFGSTDPTQLQRLEEITHPWIGRQIAQRLEELRTKKTIAAVLDAPVMFKAGWHIMCDRIVFVDADLKTRQERASSRGWDENEVLKRESFQLPLHHKRDLATDIVDNSQSTENTRNQVKRLWQQWGL